MFELKRANGKTESKTKYCLFLAVVGSLVKVLQLENPKIPDHKFLNQITLSQIENL